MFSLILFSVLLSSAFVLSGSLSVAGTFFGLLGSMALPLYSIHMKNVLPAVNQEVRGSKLSVNHICCVSIVHLISSTDLPDLAFVIL